MIQAATFIEACTRRSYDFFSGVPCSFIKPLINGVITSPGLSYIGAASEGEALGITSGAWMAGRKTVSMCQNSGFGNMVNPLTSLNRPFEIPTILLTTWRGQPGLKDEPQHEQMGRILFSMIECMELPWAFFPEETSEVDDAVQKVVTAMEKDRKPFVMVMRQGAVALGHEIPDAVVCPPQGKAEDERTGKVILTRTAAISAILEVCPKEAPIVATTGMTGRELYTIADRPNHLYTVGSMGCASAIGLGLSCGLSQDGVTKPVVVLDGDGAALMKLGNFATIGHEKPKHLLHLLLNNGTHDSTGGQHTSASNVDFSRVAAACGYASATRVDDAAGLQRAVKRSLAEPGPHLVDISILPGSPKGIGRPKIAPREVVDRFRDFVGRKA